jgi:uncharacterized protein (DUF58 family)
MVFTPRLIVLVMGGAVALFFLVLAASLTIYQSLTFLIFFNGGVVLLVLVDRQLTIKPDSLRVKRTYEHRLSLGAENLIILQVENRSQAELEFIIKDEPPVSFAAGVGSLTGRIPAGAVARLKYTLNPPKRGDYSFGNINIRYRSRLGFFLRQFKVRGENNQIRVYPNILELRKYQLLARKGHLMEGGIKPSRVIGLGTDFESVRDYQVDDEFRHINWGASARRGRLVSNRYEVDKSQNILLVLDAGRMMSGEVKHLSKLDHAINASLLLGYVGVNWGDKVGLAAFADGVKLYLPPGKGQPQLQKILTGLYNLQPEVVESDYQDACRYISFKNRKRSLVCIFTDLIDEEASKELITYVSALTRNHLVVCIAMLDSSLVSQARKMPATSQEVYEKGVAQAVLRNREKAISLLKNRGVVVISAPPEELAVSTINKYLEIKSLSKL